jgi:hypothetical protein
LIRTVSSAVHLGGLAGHASVAISILFNTPPILLRLQPHKRHTPSPPLTRPTKNSQDSQIENISATPSSLRIGRPAAIHRASAPTNDFTLAIQLGIACASLLNDLCNGLASWTRHNVRRRGLALTCDWPQPSR